MGSLFDNYYYDEKKESTNNKSKITIANKSIVALLSHLQDEDRYGMVLFDDSAYLPLKLKLSSGGDMTKIKKHILELRE